MQRLMYVYTTRTKVCWRYWNTTKKIGRKKHVEEEKLRIESWLLCICTHTHTWPTQSDFSSDNEGNGNGRSGTHLFRQLDLSKLFIWEQSLALINVGEFTHIFVCVALCVSGSGSRADFFFALPLLNLFFSLQSAASELLYAWKVSAVGPAIAFVAFQLLRTRVWLTLCIISIFIWHSCTCIAIYISHVQQV